MFRHPKFFLIKDGPGSSWALLALADRKLLVARMAYPRLLDKQPEKAMEQSATLVWPKGNTI
jgi:hypothetical protein